MKTSSKSSYQCLKYRLFTWPAFFLEKQKSLLIKTRDPKISNVFWGHCDLYMLSGLYLFCNSNFMKSLFPDTFDKLLFLYAPSFSPKSVSSSHHQTNTHHVRVLNLPNQVSSKWILNPGQAWREIENKIKWRT